MPAENGFEEVNPGMDQDVEKPEVKKDVLFYILS